MIIYPAIDLINGVVVRLHKGDFSLVTQYGDDPVATAKYYRSCGAIWLHLVDLDGAKNPQDRQIHLITRIINESGLLVQTGGGIRSFEDVESLIAAGASRVVIGSLAVQDPELVCDLLKIYGSEKICLAADVVYKDGSFFIAVSGWQEFSNLSLSDFLKIYDAKGLKHVLCTDINRDGMLTGFNRSLYSQLKKEFPNLSLQASGGASCLLDLKDLSVDGVIIGKALYEERFSLDDALKVVTC